MSSGQKACYDDAVQEAHDAHAAKLKALDPYFIANQIDVLRKYIDQMHGANVPRTKSEFYILDEMSRIIKLL